MSIIRTGFVLAVAVMLLPTEERKQAELAVTARATAERTATYCDRNPSTCATGQDLWALFLRKAEFGVELGARLLREQLLAGAATPKPTTTVSHVERAEARAEPAPRRSAPYAMDHPSRWR